MNNLNDLVDKDYNFVLKALSSLSKLTDSTHTEDKIDSFAWFVQVYPGVGLREAVRYDLRAKVAEASLEKGSNLEYC